MRNNLLNGLAIGIAVILLFDAFHATPIAEDSLLTFTCINDGDCEYFKNDSMQVRCINRKCECTLLATEQPTNCLPNERKLNNIVYGACPCTLPNSVCITEQNMCSCENGFIPSEDQRRCLPRILEKNNSCEFDSQCRAVDEFSVCDKSTKSCNCVENHITINGTCMPMAQRISCKTNDDCKKIDSLLSCAREENICICDAGYVLAVSKNETNFTCLPTLQYQDTCLNDFQCQQTLGLGAKCNNLSMCDCNNEHFARKLVTAGSINTTTTKCESLIGKLFIDLALNLKFIYFFSKKK